MYCSAMRLKYTVNIIFTALLCLLGTRIVSGQVPPSKNINEQLFEPPTWQDPLTDAQLYYPLGALEWLNALEFSAFPVIVPRTAWKVFFADTGSYQFAERYADHDYSYETWEKRVPPLQCLQSDTLLPAEHAAANVRRLCPRMRLMPNHSLPLAANLKPDYMIFFIFRQDYLRNLIRMSFFFRITPVSFGAPGPRMPGEPFM